MHMRIKGGAIEAGVPGRGSSAIGKVFTEEALESAADIGGTIPITKQDNSDQEVIGEVKEMWVEDGVLKYEGTIEDDTIADHINNDLAEVAPALLHETVGDVDMGNEPVEVSDPSVTRLFITSQTTESVPGVDSVEEDS